MKDRKQIPILYSPAMALAKVQGRKDVTRRLAKFPSPDQIKQPLLFERNQHPLLNGFAAGTAPNNEEVEMALIAQHIVPNCPWPVGAVLWGRENYRLFAGPPNDEGHYGIRLQYESDGQRVPVLNPKRDGHWHKAYEKHGTALRPSIFMPKFACRIWDEVVDVRIERLHDITEEDAIREGVMEVPSPMPDIKCYRHYLHKDPTFPVPSARESYITLWESINCKTAPWASNPWVWRIETRPIPNPLTTQQ